MLSNDCYCCDIVLLPMENFSDWLNQELKKRGWSQADLARASGKDSAVISNITNGRRGVGVELCRVIAEALKIPPETVLRAAGHLPPVPKKTEREEELLFLYRSFSEKEKEELIRYIRIRLSLQEGRN